MLRHLFRQINQVFRTNKEAETNRKDPTPLKNLGQGDGAWYTRKTILRWDLDIILHLLRLPPRQQEKVEAVLAAIPRKSRTTSLRKRRKLLGLLCSIIPDVSGSRGMFTRVQHSHKRAAGKHVQLATDVYDELEAWRELVRSLASRLTHLHKLEPFAPTWIGDTDPSGSGMGGIRQYP